MRFLRVTMTVALLIGSIVSPAHAAFPGKNGRIAFIFGPDVYTMSSDGTDLKQLTNLGPDSAAYWESWSPNGKQIVFVEFNPPNFVEQLWLMDADGRNQHLLLAEDNYNDERPSFAPDGSLIVFSRCTLAFEPCALYQIGADGSGLKALTNFELGIRDVSPDYSPDGKSIVFFSTDRDGILGALYVHSGNVSSLARLTPAELSARLPDWSPEGQRIAFSTHCCNPQNEEIWIVSRTGRELTRLTKNGNDYFAGPHDSFPSWSPEGDAIVFERDAPDFSSSAIVVMKPDGSEPRKVLALPRSSRSAALSRKFQNLGSQAQKRRLKQIEEGGALPRWGVAPN